MSDRKRGRLGKRLAVGLYVVLLAYIIVVGFASVIPAVFFAEGDPSFADRDCATGAAELRENLEATRLSFLAGKRTDLTPMRDELKQWDARLTTLEHKCGRDSTDPLLKYRHRVELSIERYVRGEGRLAHELDMARTQDGATQ